MGSAQGVLPADEIIVSNAFIPLIGKDNQPLSKSQINEFINDKEPFDFNPNFYDAFKDPAKLDNMRRNYEMSLNKQNVNAFQEAYKYINRN